MEHKTETTQITEPVNLLVTIDKNYLSPLKEMLTSYALTHKGIKTTVYVVHSALKEEDFSWLNECVQGTEIYIQGIKITESWFRGTPVLERLPEESFYRLMAFEYLPREVHRCLYLDPDIYIRKPLLSLYETELSENYIAAASHTYGISNRFLCLRLQLNGERYLNSGVMLMNLDAIRNDFTTEKILDCLNKNMQKLIMGDQDLINILFGGKAVLLDERVYNLDERSFRHHRKEFALTAVEEKTAIIHYNGKYKPWREGYKGVLDRFYPMLEQKDKAPGNNFWKRTKAIYKIMQPTKRQKIGLICFTAFLLLFLFSWIFFEKQLLEIIKEPIAFREWLNQFGVFDELIFILIRAAQTVVKFIPAEPLEIGAGYAWGTMRGMLYCLIGNVIGSIIILLLVKCFGKKLVEYFFPVKYLDSIAFLRDKKKVYFVLFALYLIPGSPKDGFTYVVGLLPVDPILFMLITSIARIPSILSSTYCGAALAEKQYLVSLFIFIAMVTTAIVGWLIHKRYVKSKEK